MSIGTTGIAFGLVYCNAVTSETDLVLWYVHLLTSSNHVCELCLSWIVFENAFFESWKTLEFGLCKSWKVLESSVLMSVRTLHCVTQSIVLSAAQFESVCFYASAAVPSLSGAGCVMLSCRPSVVLFRDICGIR